MSEPVRLAAFQKVETCDDCGEPSTAMLVYLEEDGTMTAFWVCVECRDSRWGAFKTDDMDTEYGGPLQ